MGRGITANPPFGNTEYAVVSCERRRFADTKRQRRHIRHARETERIRPASARAASRPAFAASRRPDCSTRTALRGASTRRVVRRSTFLTSHSSYPGTRRSLRSERSVIGDMPPFSAAAKTNGLNAEPGCRFAFVARLNGVRRKSRPPTSASTSPVCGSMATRAACRPG